MLAAPSPWPDVLLTSPTTAATYELYASPGAITHTSALDICRDTPLQQGLAVGKAWWDRRPAYIDSTAEWAAIVRQLDASPADKLAALPSHHVWLGLSGWSANSSLSPSLNLTWAGGELGGYVEWSSATAPQGVWSVASGNCTALNLRTGKLEVLPCASSAAMVMCRRKC